MFSKLISYSITPPGQNCARPCENVTLSHAYRTPTFSSANHPLIVDEYVSISAEKLITKSADGHYPCKPNVTMRLIYCCKVLSLGIR